MAKPLTDRQSRFVDEYLVDLNATQAAIRAGYSEKGATVRGSELLANRKVADAVAEAKAKLREKTAITQESLLNELAKVAFSNITNFIGVDGDGLPYIDLSETTKDQFAAVSECGTEVSETLAGKTTRAKIKFHSKLDAIEKLARHLGFYEIDNKQKGEAEAEAFKAFVLSVNAKGSKAAINTPQPPRPAQ